MRDPKDVEGSPGYGWGGRRYRTRGTFERREVGAAWGVGIPLKSPTLAIEVLLGLFAIGLLVAEGFGVWRMATGHGWRPVVGTVLLLPFLGIFGAGAWGAHRLRRGPRRELIVTERAISSPLGDFRWDQIERVLARSTARQGRLRRVNFILLKLTPQGETVLQRRLRPGPVNSWIDRVTDHTIRLLEAGQLDVDPWKTVQGLRALHADPSLRARLGGPGGPEVFDNQPGRPP
ncbi:MAG: hypothetical protein U0Q21_14870 [Dermatophilaceae bacterium]